jgi:hypothetical protein
MVINKSDNNSPGKTNKPPRIIRKGGVFTDRIPSKKPESTPKPKSK